MRYSTILFDLFDTLVFFEFTRLPVVNHNDRTHHSTASAVFSVFSRYFTEIGFETFYSYFRKSYSDFNMLKNEDLREYHNSKRFDIMFDDMNITGCCRELERIKEELVAAHMDCLSQSMYLPEEHRGVLEYLADRMYSMSVVTNFDHAPTVYRILRRSKIINFFNEIFISDEIGWRKPHPYIFKKVLRTLKISPGDAVIVGDNYQADILGASSIGIDTIWLDRSNNNHNSPSGTRIKRLSELKNIL